MRSIFLSTTRAPWRASAAFGASVLLLSGAMTSYAQAPADPHGQHAKADAGGQSNQQLMNQIAELRAQVAKLQAAVQQTSPGNKASAKSGMPMDAAGKSKSMGGMPGGGGMGMMDDMDDKGEMGGMSTGGMSSMPSAPAAAMGMCCMGEMGGMSGGASGGMSGMSGGAAPRAGGMAAMNAPSSAMPGQSGASHLYHVGSTGFFLNHSQHITLTADQKYTLNRLKERAMLDRASQQRKIDQAEQELYTLTGADHLDNSKVQAKIGEIEKLRAEQRMNFIRAVGEASNVLTHDQHQALMGTMAASKK